MFFVLLYNCSHTKYIEAFEAFIYFLSITWYNNNVTNIIYFHHYYGERKAMTKEDVIDHFEKLKVILNHLTLLRKEQQEVAASLIAMKEESLKEDQSDQNFFLHSFEIACLYDEQIKKELRELTASIEKAKITAKSCH